MSISCQARGCGAAIGIIMLDTTFPRVVGDVGNPETFTFPVIYHRVKGATPERVVMEVDHTLLQPFIDAAHQLMEAGARIIATSCGFLAIFQQELQQAVPVPVLSSSLLQVHMAQAVIRRHQKIGILTAHSQALSHRHLAGVGIQNYPLVIAGLEESEEFAAVFLGGKRTINIEQCRQEMAGVSGALMHAHPDIGAIVLECTNMPPYRKAVQEVTGVPVFDVVTLLNYVYATLSPPS